MSNPNHIEVWNNCLSVIRNLISEHDFKTWFSEIAPEKIEGSKLFVKVPSKAFYEYFDSKFCGILKKPLETFLGEKANLIYITPNQDNQRADSNRPQFSDKKPMASRIDSQLNPNYNIACFIEGACNKIARSAGIAISENPGSVFNPLLIYGGSGLGKTHLAQAIGLEIKARFPNAAVLYVNADTFKTQYMAACSANKLNNFIQFYQMIDTLIVDDIQIFSGLPGTQKAFFSIFDHLHQHRKQLILTSDRSPAELKVMEDRLLSRFKWGLSVELKKPDCETRASILRSKIKIAKMNIGEDVVDFLAKNIDKNVRELEGALNTIYAYSKFGNCPVTLSLAEQLVGKIAVQKNESVSLENIINNVCNYFNMTIDTFMSNSKKSEVVQARQIAMYLGRNLTKSSLQTIGHQIGNRNYATVVYACKTIANLIDTDNAFKQRVSEIESKILTA